GQLSFILLRGTAHGAIWFLINIVLSGLSKGQMPWAAIVLVSLFFFVVGCMRGRSEWNRAERRYHDAMKIMDSMAEEAARQNQGDSMS
ncbi:MAG TPA: hypothetical protein VMD55_02485, partial [Terracidiphilus sp.]|nr:hypothetical protein [Terracidiphilus sp.]